MSFLHFTMSELDKFFEQAVEEDRQAFLRSLKVRFLEQKFLYFGNGPVNYYSVPNAYPSPAVLDEESADKVAGGMREYLKKDKKLLFISLGCGTALRDRDVMRILGDEGYQLTFIGVDSSPTMIDRARKQSFGQETFNYELWVEDINTQDFYVRTQEKMKEFDQVIFMFLGSTIGNMIQTEIIDTIYNLMQPHHLLWFDCAIRASNSKTQDLQIFNQYAKNLQDQGTLRFIFYPLALLGISMDSGTVVLENFFEESIGVLNFRYSFQFQKPCTVLCLNEYIHFLPPEKIKLQDIRAYHPDTMISYFEQHDFKLKSKILINKYGQFFFEKDARGQKGASAVLQTPEAQE